MWQVPILHGPNLNLLGTREPEIYGALSFEDVLDQLKQEFTHIKLPYHQSNHEGDLIDWIQRAVGYSITGETREQVFFSSPDGYRIAGR